MLLGDALSYFSNKLQHCKIYSDSTTSLRNWYSCYVRKARIFTAWQNMRFKKVMEDPPASSEVEVFRIFVSHLMSLQKQLDTHYHTDTFLRDLLLKSVDIPSIQTALRDLMYSTSHQAVNMIANQLSETLLGRRKVSVCCRSQNH